MSLLCLPNNRKRVRRIVSCQLSTLMKQFVVKHHVPLSDGRGSKRGKNYPPPPTKRPLTRRERAQAVLAIIVGVLFVVCTFLFVLTITKKIKN